MVEFRPSADAPWMLLDPTFDLTVRDADSGLALDVEQLAEETRAQAWGAVDYVALADETAVYLATYYLDYPLLYLNPEAAPGEAGISRVSPLPYLQRMALPIVGSRDVFLVGCPAGQSVAELKVDGVSTELTCPSVFGLSTAFYASTIKALAGSAKPILYRPRRFVF